MSFRSSSTSSVEFSVFSGFILVDLGSRGLGLMAKAVLIKLDLIEREKRILSDKTREND